jgi:polyphosphate kinase 2 (PPK2 family)
LQRQKVPRPLVTRHIWRERFADIAAFERYATRQGIAIVKFFLHVSRAEQKRRLLRRLDDPRRNWKFSVDDAQERTYWRDYMRAYEDTIRHTSAPHAPWFVVPADHKWFTRLVVAAAVIDAMETMKLAFPKVTKEQRKELAKARAILEGH